MGFGLLLIGYFLVNVLSSISVLSAAMLLGYPLITIALYRLAPYHKRFYLSMWVSLPSPLFALFYTLYGFMTAGVLPELAMLGGTVLSMVEWLYFFYSLALNLLLLWSIASLSGELGLYNVQSDAWRNLTFVVIYHLCYLFIKLPIPFVVAHASAFALPTMLLWYLCIFLNLWLFFRCYRNILPEGSDASHPTEQENAARKEKHK